MHKEVPQDSLVDLQVRNVPSRYKIRMTGKGRVLLRVIVSLADRVVVQRAYLMRVALVVTEIDGQCDTCRLDVLMEESEGQDEGELVGGRELVDGRVILGWHR